ncbi:MAG: dynamin family protein, partial [Clostridiales Family XIII bacterium]|nr:dynamin family protein [Clostridiales Family XIII bacterium]
MDDSKDTKIMNIVTEALRLSKLQTSFIEELKKTNLLTGDSETSNILNITKAHDIVHNIENEIYKLENRDMVLAVMGIMKAGKSTTINAIVGKQILPNRNLPMTTVPTLIRHKPNQHEPQLFFHNNEPVNALLTKMSEIIQNIPSDNEKLIHLKTDFNEIFLTKILNSDIKTKYTGAEDIYNFLSFFNDIVRLASVLDLDFPFKSYDDLKALPIIEVEFFHLKNNNETDQWNFTLLDTPGPNESGVNEALSSLLDKQLENASSILTVLNYAEMNSIADMDVRRHIKRIASRFNDRLYIIVNRFDQRDENSKNKEEIINYVYENLMDKLIENKYIFPVSAKFAYLANRALSEILNFGKLPSISNDSSWVSDFGKLAFGEFDYQSNLSDVEKVTKAAKKLWEKSGFLEPISQVIALGKANASFLAIDSTVSKLNNYKDVINNFLNIMYSSIDTNISDIQNEINLIENELLKIENIKKITNEKIDKIIIKIVDIISSKLNDVILLIQDKIDIFFNEGTFIKEDTVIKEATVNQKGTVNKKTKVNKKAKVNKSIFNIFSFVNKIKKTKQKDFNLNDPKLCFDADSNKAEDFITNMHDSISKIYTDSLEKIDSAITTEMKECNHEFFSDSDLEEQIRNIVLNIKSSLHDTFKSNENDTFSFQYELDIPNLSEISTFMNFEKKHSKLIRHDKKIVYRIRRKNNFAGWLGEQLNTDSSSFFIGELGLGWEKIPEIERYKKINIKTIKRHYTKMVEDKITKLKDYFNTTFKIEYNKHINKLLIPVKQQFEELKGTLEQGKKTKSETKLR